MNELTAATIARADALVIGGGIAGLSAAWELTRRGLRPLLIEARGYLGGRIASGRVGGLEIDLGGEDFAGRGTQTRAMAEELGLPVVEPQGGGARVFLPPLPGSARRHWGLHPFPANSMMGIPADPTAPDVAAVVGTEGARRASEDLDMDRSVGRGCADVASLVRARMGEAVLERLVRPMVAGIHTSEPENQDVDTVLPGIREAMDQTGSLAGAVTRIRGGSRGERYPGALSVEGGMFRLIDRLVTAIEAAGGQVRTRTGARELRRGQESGAWEVTIAPTRRGPTPASEPTPVGESTVVSAPRVIIACSPEAAGRLLRGVPGVDAQVLVSPGAPVTRGFLVVRARGLDTHPVGSGLLVASSSTSRAPVGVRALSHLSAKWPWLGEEAIRLHGPGAHVLRVSAATLAPDVGEWMCDVSVLTGVDLGLGDLIDQRIVHWDGSLPPFTPRDRVRAARLVEAVERCGGVGLTGAWMSGSGISAVVAHARATGRRVADDPVWRMATEPVTKVAASAPSSGESPASRPARILRLGTRGSKLAMVQSAQVARSLEAIGATRGAPVRIELVKIRTHGDIDRSPLRRQGGGIFVARLREALREGECDLAVHSLKDLPVDPVEGIRIAAVPHREDPRDVLCGREGRALSDLPASPRIATGSVRRAAQVMLLRPDARIVDIRGNVPTRLARVGEDVDGVIVAAAGVRRLGLSEAITEFFDPSRMLSAAGQGALAVEIADDADPQLARLVEALDDGASRLSIEAERSVMRTLGAGCAAPVGALAALVDGSLRLVAGVAPLDGTAMVLRNRRIDLGEDPARAAADADRLGRDLAHDLLAAGVFRIADLSASAVEHLPGEVRP